MEDKISFPDYFKDEDPSVREVEVEYSIVCDTAPPAFEPDDITAQTGVVPDRSWKVGDKWSRVATKRETEPGKTQVHEHINTIWIVSSKNRVQGCSIEKHIEFVLEQLEPHSQYFSRFLDISGCRVFFSICRDEYDSQSHFSISSDQMRRMAQLSKEITFWCPVTPIREA